MPRELKTRKLTIRLTPSQFTIAERLADELGITVGEVFRELLLKQ